MQRRIQSALSLVKRVCSIRLQNEELSCRPICQFYNDRPFSRLLSFFFFLNWKWNSRKASRRVATEEPKKALKHARRPSLRYCNVLREENPQRENEMDNPSLEGFYA